MLHIFIPIPVRFWNRIHVFSRKNFRILQLFLIQTSAVITRDMHRLRIAQR